MPEASGKAKQISKINKDLDLIKDKVMNTLYEIPYIENNCTTMIYVHDGKMIVEIVDARTIDIMKQEKEREEQQGLAKLYTIMNG